MNTYTNNKICLCTFFEFLCTPLDKTTQKFFYKIKFPYLCTPIDKTTQKFFYKTIFSFLCTPIDKTTQKNFYKIKFSCQYRYSDMIFLIFLFFCVCVFCDELWRVLGASASFVTSCGEFWVRLRLLASNARLHTTPVLRIFPLHVPQRISLASMRHNVCPSSMDPLCNVPKHQIPKKLVKLSSLLFSGKYDLLSGFSGLVILFLYYVFRTRKLLLIQAQTSSTSCVLSLQIDCWCC